ncbi:MAG: hypothetical protein S4CHLAM2_07080 [Chlamydiales bacterium]|nr:hypothetical protein [Chlamydiales bacterium]
MSHISRSSAAHSPSSLRMSQQRPTTISGPELKSRVFVYLTQTPFYDAKSASRGLLRRISDPQIRARIEGAQEEFAPLLEFVEKNGGSWAEAQKNADPDALLKHQEAREKLNREVLEIGNLIGARMGLPELTMAVMGTPGPHSDMDIGMRPDNLDTDDALLMRSVLEALTVEMTGKLPSQAVDTEWYIPLKFFGEYIQGAGSARQAATLSLLQGCFQTVSGLSDDPDRLDTYVIREVLLAPDQWKEVKQTLYAQSRATLEKESVDKDRQRLLSHLLKQIQPKNREEAQDIWQAIQRLTSTEVQEELREVPKPGEWELYEAEWMSHLRVLLPLGKECGDAERRIQGLHTQLRRTQPDYRKPIEAQIDQACVDQLQRYLAINRRQPESTFSPDEQITTLMSEIGQAKLRERESRVKILAETGRRLSGRRAMQPEEIKKMGRRRNSLTAKQVFQISDQLESARRNSVGKQAALSKVRRILDPAEEGKSVTVSVLLLAGHERTGQFAHAIAAGNAEPKAAISAGKYNLRVMEANLVALERCKQQMKPVPYSLKLKLKQAEELYFKAHQLERCKRAHTLNTVATARFLRDAILVNHPDLNPDQLEAELTELLREYDPNGKEYGTLTSGGKIIHKSEIVSKIAETLAERGYIKVEPYQRLDKENAARVMPTDGKILLILQARAGYKKGKPNGEDLSSYHQSASRLTLEWLGLDSSETVRAYEREVLDFTRTTQALLHDLDAEHQLGIVPQFDLGFAKTNASVALGGAAEAL